MEILSNENFLPPSALSVPFAGAAVKKAKMPLSRFLVYALLGGVFIALGGLLSVLVAGGMPGIARENPGLVKFVAGAMFPLGLVLVVIAGAGLFTSDCATLPMAFWQKKISLTDVVKVAGLGYLANFIGALLVAWLFAVQTGTLTKEPWSQYAIQLAVHKTDATFWKVFAKGIGANMMVCLAVWMSAAAKDISGKALMIWMPVMAFVAFGWEHSIANMFFIPLAMMLDAPIGMEAFLVNNLLPATLGNIVGGACFVALPYYFIWGNEPAKNTKHIQHTNHSDRNARRQDLFTQLN